MRILLFPVALTVLLTGCTDFKSTLGLERSSPDEFSVVTRAPLSLPTTYDLRPPRAGAPRPQEKTSTQAAEQTLFGRTQTGGVVTANGQGLQPVKVIGNGEQGLLAKTGANKNSSNIRNILAAEAPKKAEDKDVLDALEDIRTQQKPDPVVDALGETKRLRTNQKQGEPVTKGDVKKQDPKEKTIFDWLGF